MKGLTSCLTGKVWMEHFDTSHLSKSVSVCVCLCVKNKIVSDAVLVKESLEIAGFNYHGLRNGDEVIP